MHVLSPKSSTRTGRAEFARSSAVARAGKQRSTTRKQRRSGLIDPRLVQPKFLGTVRPHYRRILATASGGFDVRECASYVERSRPPFLLIALKRNAPMKNPCVFIALATLFATVFGAPPSTPKRPVPDPYHGVKVGDDYRWLQNWNDPEVKQWSDAENALARQYL